MKLENKIAIITGASRGIGFSIAKAYLKEGAKIVLCGSNIDNAQKAKNTLVKEFPNADILPIGVNMSDGISIKKMVDDTVAYYGTVDILVNNAGVTSAMAIMDMSDEDFDSVIRINLSGPFKAIREVAKVMKNKGGSIINTSSMMGTYGGKMQSAYSSSKFGVNGLTKSCAKELGVYNIRVNAVAPGVVATDMVANSVDPLTLSALKGLTPLGRMANPEEMSGAYVYLASDEASFTTGTIIHVDGGIVM